MPTSKSKPDLVYPCKGGCGEMLTYVRKQRGGTKKLRCKPCYRKYVNAKRRKGGAWYRG